MATLGNDCYFFCTSTCAKGAACPFRHVEAAKTCRIICQHWQMGACLRPMCKFRHSDFIIQVDTSEVPCYWESQPAGCMKKNCPYKHSKPLQVDEKTAAGALSLQVDPIVSASQSNESTPNSEDIKLQNIVQPTVTSAASQSSGDSESASSSQRPLALQDSDIQADKPKTESDDSKDLKSDNSSLSLTLQEPEVKRKKIKVSPVSKIKLKSLRTMQKKRHKNVTDSSAAGCTVKLKKNPEQPRKSVKERLGRAPVSRPTISPSPEESDSGSDSESDDSIENIKVMSMEEILRQKALESMMKKRVGESKTARGYASSAVVKKQTSLRTAEKKISNLASALDSKTQTVQKDMQGLKRRSNTYVTSSTKTVKHFPAAENSSSSSSSEEELCDENKTSRQSSSVSSSDSSSASSTSDTDEDSTDDSEDLDIRRVVVDLESEKAARKKATESFMKKQKLNAFNTRDNIKKGRVIQRLAKQAKASAAKKTEIEEHRMKKRSVNIDYDSDDFVYSRVQEPLKLHVRDRLGKSTSLHKASSDARLLSRAEKFGSEIGSTSVAISKVNPLRVPTVSRSSSSEDDSNPLTEVKVKSLEEIRMEKIKIMAQKNEQKFSTQEDDTVIQTPVSFKNRLCTAPEKLQKQEREVVHSEARQVVLLNGAKGDDFKEVKPSDEQKKTKKRPWRTVRSNTNQSTLDAIACDERTSIVSSPSSDRGDNSVELDHHMKIPATDESPFERLRRKALMKKLQAGESKKFKKSPVNEGVKTEDDGFENPEFSQVVEINRPLKTHKHKHGHSHKKVKTERQIYLPPAMKTAASKPSLIPESFSPQQELSMAAATKVSPLKREPHPIGAAWAAGLTLSSKGISVRMPEYTSLTAGNVDKSGRIKVPEQLADRDISTRSKEAASSSKMPESATESSVTIKSFAEIMAEKRKRRLEMQAQKAGITSSVVTSSLEPSIQFSSSASTNQLKSNICQSVDVKSASSSIYTLDQLSDTSKTAINSGQASKQSLVTTVKEVTSDIHVSSVSSSAAAVSSSTTPSSQDLARPIGQKVRLKSMKRNNADKRDKVPKLFTKRNDLEPDSQSCTVTSEDSSSSMLSSSLYPDTSTLSRTVTSSRDNTSLLHSGLNKTSHPANKPFSTSSIETTTKGVNMTDNGSVSKLPIHVNTPDVKEQTHSSKQNVAVLKDDSDHTKKNTRLSLEDEFSFFEDDDMLVEDSSILENIEPIDNLLQDIDDLLS